MQALLLFLLVFFGHFLADFTPLSTPWMLAAKKFGKPLFPIFCHALVQTWMLVIMVLGWRLFCVCKVIDYDFGFRVVAVIWMQLATHHYIDDVWKGRVTHRHKELQDLSNHPFWRLLGFDQYLHEVVLLVTCFYLLGWT